MHQGVFWDPKRNLWYPAEEMGGPALKEGASMRALAHFPPWPTHPSREWLDLPKDGKSDPGAILRPFFFFLEA